MKATELREMTAEQLQAKLGELKEELFNLRFQLEVKHDIARVMTVLREKNA